MSKVEIYETSLHLEADQMKTIEIHRHRDDGQSEFQIVVVDKFATRMFDRLVKIYREGGLNGCVILRESRRPTAVFRSYTNEVQKRKAK